MNYEFVRHSFEIETIREYSAFLSSPFVVTSDFFKEERTTPEYLSWQYATNPSGQALGYSAIYDGKIVGHFSTLPIEHYIYGRRTKGLLALNLVTHPEHRGKGLFLEMCRRTFDDAVSSDYQYIIGVANQNSTHGLVDRLGFELVSSLDVIAGYGNLMLDKQSDYAFRSLWDHEKLIWRLSNPSARYYLNNDSIICPTGKFGIYAQMFQGIDRGSIFNETDRDKSKLRVWIGLAKYRHNFSTHIKIPQIFKPVPLNFIFKNLQGNNWKLLKQDVLLELFDFDAF